MNTSIFFTLLLLAAGAILLSLAKTRHVINFKSLNLYPEGLAYDPSAQRFIVGSIKHRTFHSVSDVSVVHTLISDRSLPPNSTILGLAIDSLNNRLLACIHSFPPLPPFDALVAYDLRSGRQEFISVLFTPDGSAAAVNDVTVDQKGNAYVTDSVGNFIWKVNHEGKAYVLSRSPLFTSFPVDVNAPFSECGLNGIIYDKKGYLLVVQSNTGKMFKVDANEGTTSLVQLPDELTLPDGIAIREKDGVVLVVSPYGNLWCLKSDDDWEKGVIYDKIALDEERFPTSVVVGREDRVYVLYGSVLEGIMGKDGREWFGIEEVRCGKGNRDEKFWLYALVGLGLACLLFWKFQVRQLVNNFDQKTH